MSETRPECEHEFAEVVFSFSGWVECTLCGFRPDEDSWVSL